MSTFIKFGIFYAILLVIAYLFLAHFKITHFFLGAAILVGLPISAIGWLSHTSKF